MLREANNADFVPTRRFLRRCQRFVAGRVECERPASARAHAAWAELQRSRPVAVAVRGRRRYWWFHDRFWWDEDELEDIDVMALVVERERRAQRRLDRARALLAAADPGGDGTTTRTGISLEVKRAVWERCGGRCIACGSEQVLEFDHVIPLAMGGSNGERNLQLLCADCNRAKGDSL
jgi:hypothetical protein